MRVVHAADLHLDSPLRGLSRYEGAPEEDIRGAARTALRNLVDLTVRQKADALLLAGDIYDGDWRDYNTGLFFGVQMKRLQEAEIPVFLIRGNHDAQSRITSTLSMPENVYQFRTDQPNSHPFEDKGFVVHGQGFARADVRENLVTGYPQPLPGLVNIGLLHTAVEGNSNHATYAPCTLTELRDKGYDYWALGHVHQRTVLSEDDEPPIIFPGNLQGRHARETGPKGATVVEFDGDGRCVSVTPHTLDVVRWQQITVDVVDCVDYDDVCVAVRDKAKPELDAAGGRLLAARIVLQGDPAGAQSFLWQDQERAATEIRLAAAETERLWVEKVKLTVAPEAVAPALTGVAVDGLRRAAEALGANEEALREAVRGAALERHRHVLAEGELDLADGPTLRRLLDEAVDLLVATVAPGAADAEGDQ